MFTKVDSNSFGSKTWPRLRLSNLFLILYFHLVCVFICLLWKYQNVWLWEAALVGNAMQYTLYTLSNCSSIPRNSWILSGPRVMKTHYQPVSIFLLTLMTKLLDINTALVLAKLAKVEKSYATSLWRKTTPEENLRGEGGIQWPVWCSKYNVKGQWQCFKI